MLSLRRSVGALCSFYLHASLPPSCSCCAGVVTGADVSLVVSGRQDMSYQNSWSWFLKPRAQAKEKKLLENFHAVSTGPVFVFLCICRGLRPAGVLCPNRWLRDRAAADCAWMTMLFAFCSHGFRGMAGC